MEYVYSRIMEICSSKYGVSLDDMRSRSRQRFKVRARQLSSKIMHDEFGVPYKKIAKLICKEGFDHSSVIHGKNRFDTLLQVNDSEATIPYREALIEVKKEIIKKPQILVTYDDSEVSHHELIKYISKEFPNVTFEYI